MDRIDAMRAFVTSVDRGSLAAAARRLALSPATMSRAIAMLERRLGMRLLHRSTRALHLTQFGETYLNTCREVLAALDAAERGAQAEQERPSGILTITAPLVFANIVEEGIDLAVRVAHLPDSNLAATRVGEVRRVLCAAPAYINRRGAPRAPAALREHDCIMERDAAETELWRFVTALRCGRGGLRCRRARHHASDVLSGCRGGRCRQARRTSGAARTCALPGAPGNAFDAIQNDEAKSLLELRRAAPEACLAECSSRDGICYPPSSSPIGIPGGVGTGGAATNLAGS